MEPSDLFKPPQFTYDIKRDCYRANKMNSSVSWEYNLQTLQANVPFMLGMTYNSIRRPNMGLRINGKLVLNNIFSKYTSSYDKLLSVRLEEGPFYLTKGKNTLELISLGIFPDIYGIELYPQKESPNQSISAFSYKMADFIYLDCYNLYGGFFWHINNFIMCCYFADKFGKIPIVNYTNSLFMNNTSAENHMLQQNDNWFYNYFKNYADIPPSYYQAVINCPNKIRINNVTVENYRKHKRFCNDNQVLQFKREAFQYIRERVYQEKAHKEIIKKYLKPLPHIENMVTQIKAEIFPPKNDLQRFIGIHYRGTDKIEEELNKEQSPKHFKYEDIYNLIVDTAKELIKENGQYDIYIVGCSDEQPFLDYLKKKLKHKMIFYQGAKRASINTSDLKEDFTSIPNRDKQIDIKTLNDKQLQVHQKRQELIDNSVHMGSKNISNYKKGLDCLVDVLLLDGVDVLLQSKGNFSLYCEYFNKNENLKVKLIHEHINK